MLEDCLNTCISVECKVFQSVSFLKIAQRNSLHPHAFHSSAHSTNVRHLYVLSSCMHTYLTYIMHDPFRHDRIAAAYNICGSAKDIITDICPFNDNCLCDYRLGSDFNFLIFSV